MPDLKVTDTFPKSGRVTEALVQAERLITLAFALVLFAHIGKHFRLLGGVALGQFGDQHCPVRHAILIREAYLGEHTLDRALREEDKH
uniref:Uncharacterized protein n=1 Tax=Anopheles stephensi TaxID=30069 RepID=A0A182YDT1_ANOST